MTISTTSNATTVLGNGSTSTFTYPFVADTASEIQVVYTDTSGTQTLLTPSQYTLFINPPATGSLHSVGGNVVYPKSGPAIGTGTSLSISRIVPLNQLTSISNQGNFSPQVIESALDELCLEIQQVSGRTGQSRGTWQTAITYNYGDFVQDGANGANTLNYYTCVIPNTSGVWATDLANGDWSLGFNTAAVIGYSNSAAASATSAAASASTATTQASNASTSATNASSSAASASTSAATSTTQAGISTAAANSALSSQTAAAASATASANSATSASSSATSASTSASTATTQASSASTSATASAASAAASAASAVLAGSTLTATSTTNNTIGTGNFTFTTQANKNFFPGQPIIAASNANGANYIHGFVSSYSGTTLVITEADNGGSGAHSDWNISVSGPQGTSGVGSGTVTSVSVTTANGVSGSVATATSTPAITLTLGAITPSSVAASGTVTGSNLSGTNTGDQTTVSGNAGTATALQTARAIYGNNFDGTAALTQVIASTYGGTGNGFTKISGPAGAEKTFTLPNSSATILTDNTAVTVAQGGTGLGTLTLNNVILGNGTSTPQFVAPGTSGNILTSNGTTWQSTAFVGSSSVIYNAQSSGYTILAADNSKLVDFTGSSSQTFAFTAAATLGSGWFCYIRNNGTSNAQLTLDPNASELIDGVTSYIMYAGEVRLVQCTGTAFNSIILNGGVAIFTSSGSWTRPPGYSYFTAEVCSSGGNGASRSTTGNAGGGGGGYVAKYFLPSSYFVAVGSTETITVGGTVSGVTGNTNGSSANFSAITINGTTYKTGDSNIVPTNAANGSAVVGGTVSGLGTFNATTYAIGVGITANATIGGNVTSGNVPTLDTFGNGLGLPGAGGPCASTAGGTRTGGLSVGYGAGGAGGTSGGSGNGTAGTAPGGGGGGSCGGTSGAGAAGQVIIRGII